MKKFFSIILLTVAFIFISCSSAEDDFNGGNQTLKEKADSIISSTEWTYEIEGSRLTQKIPAVPFMSDSVKSDLYTLGARSKKSVPLYPKLPDFYELDLSLLGEEEKLLLISFCDALVKGLDASSFMEKSGIYSLTVFMYDLRMELGQKFFLDSYKAGKPAFFEDTYECPVRFFLKDSSYFDVLVYLCKRNENWKVSQVLLRGQ